MVAVLALEPEGRVQVVQEEVELGLPDERLPAAMPAITVLITVVQAAVAGPEGHSMDLELLLAMAKEAECLHWDQLMEREAIARHLLDLRSYYLFKFLINLALFQS